MELGIGREGGDIFGEPAPGATGALHITSAAVGESGRDPYIEVVTKIEELREQLTKSSLSNTAG